MNEAYRKEEGSRLAKALVIPTLVTLTVSGGVYAVVAAHADPLPTKEIIEQRNAFWESLDNGGLEGDTALAALSRDLVEIDEKDEWSDVSTFRNPLVYKYQNLSSTLGMDIGNDFGHFSEGFLGDAQRAVDGSVEGLVEDPNAPKPTRLIDNPFLCLLLTLGIAQGLSWIIAAVARWDNGDEMVPPFKGIKTSSRATIWVFGAPGVLIWKAKLKISNWFKNMDKRAEAKNLAAQHKLEESSHPLGEELRKARLALEELQTLPSTAKVEKARFEASRTIRDLREFIKEDTTLEADLRAVKAEEILKNSQELLALHKKASEENFKTLDMLK